MNYKRLPFRSQRDPSQASLAQKFVVWLLHLLMTLLLRLEVIGLENIPVAGPVIIIINHIAFLDPLMVCGVAPRRVIPMAKKEAFDSLLWRPFLKLYGAISVKRGEADPGAIKAALQILKYNGVILMAPEGTRSPTCELQTGKEGAVLIALHANAAIVPIGITGTQRLKAYWTRLKRAPVRLAVGPSFRLRSAAANGRTRRTETAIMTQELMVRLARQLPPEFRGVYQEFENASEIYLWSTENDLTPPQF
jgi:1-acyl-sn-glycerol-3-phosphate acyltransferase